MADQPENLVLALLRQLHAKIDENSRGLNAKIDLVIRDMAFVRSDMAVLKAEQEDQSATLHWLRHAIAPGEMEATNQDIADLKRRVEALEGRREP